MKDPAYRIADTYVGPDRDEWLTRWSLHQCYPMRRAKRSRSRSAWSPAEVWPPKLLPDQLHDRYIGTLSITDRPPSDR
jgi:hypothetical protein